MASLPQACKNVMVVDDDLGIREMLTMALEDEGYQVATASNGLDAITQLRQGMTLPCLILLDLNMPIMTGWEFRREQTHDPVLTPIPVVVVSADRSLQQQQRPSIDAAGFLAKPIDFARLFNLVSHYCG